MAATPIHRSTRVVFVLDLIFSLVAGLALVLLATRTEDYFAWTVKIPLTAAFLGSGYLAAVAMLVPSFRVTEWRRVRIVPVMGFTLTFVTAVVTIWHIGEFHLGAGSGTARVAGWAWLVVYLTIPVLLAAVFLAQQRAGGRVERDVSEPLLPLTRGVLGAQAVAAAVLGAGLVLAPRTFDVAWPWPLPPLSAGAVGAWLLTIAAGSGWALYDGDWRAFRIAIPGLAAYGLFVGLGIAVHPDPLAAGDGQERLFVAGLVVLLVTAAVATVRQERHHASAVSVAPAQVR